MRTPDYTNPPRQERGGREEVTPPPGEVPGKSYWQGQGHSGSDVTVAEGTSHGHQPVKL